MKLSSSWIWFLGVLCLVVTPLMRAGAEDTFVLAGKVLGSDGALVEGAEVYVYDSARVARPANFISNRTGSDGRYQLVLPVDKKYWAVAVLRQGGSRIGPLAKSDRHSGEPVAFAYEGQSDKGLDFVVRDLREAARQGQKRGPDLVAVQGRVLDAQGNPLEMAYVMAAPRQTFGEFPQYLSAWTDGLGTYVLYVPRGHFFLGAANLYPPAPAFILPEERDFLEDVTGLDLVLRPQAADPKVP